MSIYDQIMALDSDTRIKLLSGLDAVNERDLEHNFREMLDECNPVYKLGDLTFYPSDILNSCDPVAYRCAFADYVSEDDQVIEINGLYYQASDVETALDALETPED